MDMYNYAKQLHSIWTHAVELYQDGNRDVPAYFNDAQMQFLQSIGHTAREVYDFAEDFVNSGEPDFTTFALCAEARRNYFMLKQGGQPSEKSIDMASLPAKSAAVRGIEWLPRIVPKALAKLRGEMPDELMYGCGGDRRFFKTHGIHPAEFLAVVAHFEHDVEGIYDWVQKRAKV
ncbi:MAG: DUF5069 domain-containing protein [Verrucomicrobia bacterium]|nr:DUF5069 domain-containing protein [Verrucomicrobiota bacterium]